MILRCNLLEKLVRSEIIIDYVLNAEIKKIVIFSCGNAAEFLSEKIEEKDLKINLLRIMPNEGDLKSQRWFRKEEIKKWFPDSFDATSGHLSLILMIRIAKILANEDSLINIFKSNLNGEFEIPTGSGETIICMKMAFPNLKFIPLYNLEGENGTKYDEENPLNWLVERWFKNVK